MGIEAGKSILIDTNCFIYYFENNIDYADNIEEVFIGIQNGKNRAIVSVLTISEILTLPYKENNIFLSNRYKLILTNYPNLAIKEVDFEIADLAAKIRGEYNVKLPDAIIIATCLKYKVDYFFSNDLRLRNICEREGIRMIDFNML